eukprot:scaffold117618_cov35-Prasinocladus_malaysianus.AAC.4
MPALLARCSLHRCCCLTLDSVKDDDALIICHVHSGLLAADFQRAAEQTLYCKGMRRYGRISDATADR